MMYGDRLVRGVSSRKCQQEPLSYPPLRHSS